MILVSTAVSFSLQTIIRGLTETLAEKAQGQNDSIDQQ